MSAKSRSISLSNTSKDKEQCTKLAKLKRLKMQEKLLINNINLNIESNSINMQHKVFVENKRTALLTEVKKKYQDIKSLFEEIKYNSENVHNMDLQQVKRDVLTLEDNLTLFKRLIHKELCNLKEEEENLVQEVNDENIDVNKHIRMKSKVKSFNDIVPSPVKNIINTPYKYKEVQALHEFLKGSGKYGGWHEFNHNLFVHCRQKYLRNLSSVDDNLSYQDAIRHLIKELLGKIIGTTKEKIIEHENWYKKYLELKVAQEEAMRKWRQSRSHKRSQIRDEQGFHKNNVKEEQSQKSHVKKGDLHAELYSPSTVSSINIDEVDIEKMYEGMIDKENNLSYVSDNEGQLMIVERKAKCNNKTFSNKESTVFKNTEVWTNRILKGKNTDDTNTIKNFNLDNITKYGIPKWRQGLQKV